MAAEGIGPTPGEYIRHHLTHLTNQKQGFIVTGWPGHSLNDYFLGLGLGVDAICTDIPVQVQEYIDRKK